MLNRNGMYFKFSVLLHKKCCSIGIKEIFKEVDNIIRLAAEYET